LAIFPLSVEMVRQQRSQRELALEEVPMAATKPWTDYANLGLFTDLYELTMLQAYLERGMVETATFSLFVRRLPERRNYLLACGLEDVLGYLESLRFSRDGLDYLASLARFSERFLRWLEEFRFTGDVDAVPEGTPVFANEPLLEITAPIAQAQLVETFVMNQMHLQTVLASKAARVVTAAAGRGVVDFGPRRMHGIDAAIKAARAFYIAGVAATSNTLAGQIYGVPVAGTMAHSFVQAADNEMAAFRAFAALYPETILLVDTYDTLQGVRHVIALAREMGDAFRVRAIRLDSGDLVDLAAKARAMLDAAGLQGVEIFASGSLDEDAIALILAKGAPITGFGVGTAMGVSQDAPGLDIAYKLCAYGGRGRLKLSAGKPVLPGRKQVFRIEEDGRAVRDVIARADEILPGRRLLCPVMRGGRRLLEGLGDLQAARRRAQDEIDRLPDPVRAIRPAEPRYPIEVSAALRAYQKEVARDVEAAEEDIAAGPR
jgi:nicotinate phosphoribosyltransferase